MKLISTPEGIARLVARAVMLGTKAEHGLTEEMIGALITSQIRTSGDFTLFEDKPATEKRSESVEQTHGNLVDMYFASHQQPRRGPKAIPIPHAK